MSAANKSFHMRNKKGKQRSKYTRDDFLKNATPIFVSNIPLHMTRTRLRKVFGEFGSILDVIISRIRHEYLVAQIFFQSYEEAKASLSMNGKMILPNVIQVDLKIPEIISHETDREDVSERGMHEKFQSCGNIKYVRIVETAEGSDTYICFEEPKSVSLAKKMHRKTLDKD